MFIKCIPQFKFYLYKTLHICQFRRGTLLVRVSEWVSPLWHILIMSQPVFALSPYCCTLRGEATNTNFIVFSLTRSGLEPTFYHTWGEHANHYTTNAVGTYLNMSFWLKYFWTFRFSSFNIYNWIPTVSATHPRCFA